jgi:glycosyltransferase involved in cell wall biosynthesis
MEVSHVRVLLYAPVDLNLIDGSAIWCASVAQMLCQEAQVYVDVLLHTALKRDINTVTFVDEGRIRLLDPWSPRGCPALRAAGGKLGPRLTPEQAFERIERLHVGEPYDLLVLRGGPVCRLVAAEPRLASRSWFYLTQLGADYETVRAIAHSNGRIACQTPLLQEFLEGMLGPAPERYVPLPPMVPRLLCDRPRTGRVGRKLCYVGKFEANYMIEEMIAALGNLRKRLPDTELVIAGDKFHDPEQTGAFPRRVTAALQNTPGLVWHGGLPRDEVGELMTRCDVGSCWRSTAYDDSLELSTKALEYAAAGLPVLLNPSRVNRLVFGEEYPLFVDSPESFMDRVTAAFDDDTVYRRAAEIAFETCQRFTFAQVNRRLQPFLCACRPSGTRVTEVRRPKRLVFAGHDFKFCREIIEHFEARPDCVVRLDEWSGHARHDENRSEELLRWADAVWCEWCLGNAVWYSARVRPAQQLVIRLHRQEVTTQYPDEVTWSNVGRLVFIAPSVQKTILERLGAGTVAGTRLIYNTFACERFDREKTAGFEFRLGMLGYCPKLKNPRLALEILVRLLERDPRWKLALAGQHPQDYAWLWARAEERAYYEQLEEFIGAHNLESAVLRQGWTDDLSAWYAGVGFILSCSDFEGSHQAIPEGMAAGCVPVVRRWEGAAELYPNSLLFDTPAEAVEYIERITAEGLLPQLARQARLEARTRFDRHAILPQLEPVLLGTPVAAAPAALPASSSG